MSQNVQTAKTPEKAGAVNEIVEIVKTVVYFVDPRYAADPDTRGTAEITLSYTFMPAVTGARMAASAAGPHHPSPPAGEGGPRERVG